MSVGYFTTDFCFVREDHSLPEIHCLYLVTEWHILQLEEDCIWEQDGAPPLNDLVFSRHRWFDRCVDHLVVLI